MPKYYTPPSRIRFANLDQVAFKKMAMTVEVCVQVVSDRSHSDLSYSGVIRFRRDDWKRYTVVWLYGDSVGTSLQDFVQPSITDASASTYPENHHLTSPFAPDLVTITGSNFVNGTQFLVNNVPVSGIVLNRNTAVLTMSTQSAEQANVPIRAVRPDYRSSTLYTGFSYEMRPLVSGTNYTGTFLDGGPAIVISGNFFKQNSNVLFTSGTATVWSNNSTLQASTSLGTFTPVFPATGTYTLQVKSPSGLTSSVNASSTIVVAYRAPRITSILPYNTGSVVGTASFSIIGDHFLSGAQVYFGTTASLSQSRISSDRIDVLSPGHAPGQVFVTVQNAEDSQVSNNFPFQYVIPIPTIVDANFSGTTIFTRKTGSNGSQLFITGTNFTGSDPSMTVTQITLLSGTFATASTNFTVNSPTEIVYTIGALVTGSHYDLEVSNSAGTATLPGAFEYQDIPVVTSIAPISGTTAGGLFVLIQGRPFYTGASQAKFGGVFGSGQAVYNVNLMSAVTPQATNLDGGAVTVSVQNYGSVEGGLTNAFEYVAFPTASYVRSAKGNSRVPAETVSSVTLVGTRFLADKSGARGTTIQLSTESGTIPTSFIDRTQVTFNVQPHAAGFASLTATNRDIASGVPLANAIEYVNTPTITSVSQNAVVITGGTTVAITGTNFINNTDTVVFVGTTQVAATVINSTRLTFVTPALAAGSYNLTVVNRATTVSNIVSLLYIAQPQIFSLSITSGSNAGGTTVVVNGSGYISGSTSASLSSSVYGNQNFAATYISPTQFSFITPTLVPLSRGAFNLVVSVMGLTATSASAFTYEQQPLISSITPTTVLTGGTTAVAIGGSGFISGVSTVSVDSVIVASTFVSSTLLNFIAPAHATGSATIRVANTFLSATNNQLVYASQPPPTISTIYVGATPTNTTGQAKWSTNGFMPHQGVYSAYADALGGNYFTPSMTMTLVPFDGSPNVNVAFSVQNATLLYFNMPQHAATPGYIVLNNENGTSNYAQFRWNAIPQFQSINPTFGRYNSQFVVYVTGSGFQSGETWLSLPNSVAMTTFVQSTSTLFAYWPVGWNSSIDQVYSNFVINNSSTLNECSTSVNSAFRTVNPPNVNSLLYDVYPLPTQGGTQFLIVPSDSTYLTGGAIPMSWYVGFGLTRQGYTNRNTTKYPPNTGSLATAPAHASGSDPIWLGYTNELGSAIVGSGLYTSWAPPPALSGTILNNYSSYVHGFTNGFSGNVTIGTSPYLYVSGVGGVPPYTASLVSAGGSGNGPALGVAYAIVAGYTKAVRGYGTIYYPDYEIYRSQNYTWLVQDAVGQSWSSPVITIYYDLYPVVNTGGGGGCVTPNALIYMANGSEVPAGDIKVGDFVRTYTELISDANLGDYPVVYVERLQARKVRVEFEDGRSVSVTHNHRFATTDGWIGAESLYAGQIVKGTTPGKVRSVLPDGVGEVVKIMVAGAHTYISNGLLSHNLKPQIP